MSREPQTLHRVFRPAPAADRLLEAVRIMDAGGSNLRPLVDAALSEARQQGRDREPLDVDRLTAAILASRRYDSTDPSQWDTPYIARQDAEAIAEEWVRGPQVRGGG